MCGVCGIVRLDDGPVDESALARMIDAMAHRGPDGDGVWISDDKTVGLGHRRLSIIDLSPLGAQPMTNEDGSVITTFNGEIYNYLDLRMRLQGRHRFRSQTDTETLVHLWEEKGPEMPAELDGDFSFGVWDQNKKQLFLARDRAGVKPLYYARTRNAFVFASEVRAIVASGLVDFAIDDEAFYHYLTFLVSPPPQTLVRGIRKLPIGSALLVDQASGEHNDWRYWEPLPGQLDLSGHDLDADFAELYDAAVRKRLMADVPTGVLFSGGVDSTLNTGSFMEATAPTPVRTFNVCISGSKYEEESRFAREMAAHLGTEHYEVEISVDDLLDGVDILANAQDEPISDPVCLPLYFVTKLAREKNTVVLQAGEGADELFCGYNNYTRFLGHHRRYWRPLSALPRSAASLFSVLSRPFGGHPLGGKIFDILRRRSLGQEFFMGSAIGYYESEKKPILSADLSARAAGWDSFNVVRPYYDRLKEAAPDAGFLETLSFIELNLRLPELLLMRADKMAMANSVEVRVPFLDHKLIEFAMSVPQDFKLRNGVPKEPIKQAALRYAPRESIYRPKSGFGAPVHEWFHGRLGEKLRADLGDASLGADQYFDCGQLYKALDRGPRSVNEGFKLWLIYNFLSWKRSMKDVGHPVVT